MKQQTSSRARVRTQAPECNKRVGLPGAAAGRASLKMRPAAAPACPPPLHPSCERGYRDRSRHHPHHHGRVPWPSPPSNAGRLRLVYVLQSPRSRKSAGLAHGANPADLPLLSLRSGTEVFAPFGHAQRAQTRFCRLPRYRVSCIKSGVRSSMRTSGVFYAAPSRERSKE